MKVKGVTPKKSTAMQLQQEAEAIRKQLENKPGPEPEAPAPKPATEAKKAKPAKTPEPPPAKRTRRRMRPVEAVTRLTVDLPADLYDEISREAHGRYMTLKGYVVSVLRARKG